MDGLRQPVNSHVKSPMAIPILGEIERFITEHGSSAVLKEWLFLLQDKIVLLKEAVSKLEQDKSNLKTQIEVLQIKLASASNAKQFREERGALFKRRAVGGQHQAVYCPRCRQTASPSPPGSELNCNYGWFWSFTEEELASVLSQLSALLVRSSSYTAAGWCCVLPHLPVAPNDRLLGLAPQGRPCPN